MKKYIRSSESWKNIDKADKEDLFNDVLFEASEDNNLDYDADRSGVSFFYRDGDDEGDFAFSIDNDEMDSLLEDYFQESKTRKEFISKLSKYISMYA